MNQKVDYIQINEITYKIIENDLKKLEFLIKIFLWQKVQQFLAFLFSFNFCIVKIPERIIKQIKKCHFFIFLGRKCFCSIWPKFSCAEFRPNQPKTRIAVLTFFLISSWQLNKTLKFAPHFFIKVTF